MRILLVVGIQLVLALSLDPSIALSMSGKNKAISSDEPAPTSSQSRVGATGTVRTESGAPVAGAVIFAKSLDTPGKPVPEIAIVTNDAGRFHWPLKPGVYELTPLLDGRRGNSAVVTVPNGGTGKVDLTISR